VWLCGARLRCRKRGIIWTNLYDDTTAYAVRVGASINPLLPAGCRPVSVVWSIDTDTTRREMTPTARVCIVAWAELGILHNRQGKVPFNPWPWPWPRFSPPVSTWLQHSDATLVSWGPLPLCPFHGVLYNST